MSYDNVTISLITEIKICIDEIKVKKIKIISFPLLNRVKNN